MVHHNKGKTCLLPALVGVFLVVWVWGDAPSKPYSVARKTIDDTLKVLRQVDAGDGLSKAEAHVVASCFSTAFAPLWVPRSDAILTNEAWHFPTGGCGVFDVPSAIFAVHSISGAVSLVPTTQDGDEAQWAPRFADLGALIAALKRTRDATQVPEPW